MTQAAVELQRVRWRCRRGLLELDIVLGRFIQQYPGLSTQQKLAFDGLLDMPDNELWDMISGKKSVLQEDQRALMEMISAA